MSERKIIRTDTEGRDVTNLPGMWSEDDTINGPSVGQTLKCNQRQNGCTGRDHTGEACECHYCGGKGVITADEVVKLRDRLEELHGEEMSRELIAKEDAAELAQPFTVEWLCEIGGERTSCDVAFRNEHDDCLACLLLSFGHKWFFNSRGVSTPITTRGDVLKWLDVLCVPATTKGGDK